MQKLQSAVFGSWFSCKIDPLFPLSNFSRSKQVLTLISRTPCDLLVLYEQGPLLPELEEGCFDDYQYFGLGYCLCYCKFPPA